MRFEGEDVPSIKSLDEDGLVVYSGSFQKCWRPEYGWVCGRAQAAAQKMVVCKQGEDVHTAMWPQIICERFMADAGFEAHLESLRSLYRKKARLMLSLIEEHLVPAGITYAPTQGGLFVWCRLPDGVDMPSFCKRAVIDYKVAIVPGNAF